MFIESLAQTILLCRFQEDDTKITADDAIITSNALTCMYEATSREFGLVIICLTVRQLKRHQDMLELCHCLKTHPLTKSKPMVVSVDGLHREMTAKLADDGVRFMDVRNPGAPIDPDSLLNRVQSDDPSIQIDRILHRLCPCIHYEPIDEHRELTTCGAYGNKMVLGGQRRHEVCETEDHIYCDQFLCPRFNL